MYKIGGDVPQESVLSSIFCTIFASDFSIAENTLIGTYADDTAILFSSSDPTTVSYQQNFVLAEYSCLHNG